jgi:DNA recombination protein RmuC|tara:strand:- start:172 stop:1410 length:1239 start_codon:yes stop_codon:yes gene_type:complete
MEYVFYLIIIALFIFFYFKKDTATETISKELKQQISDQNNQIIILSKDNSTQTERIKTLEISLKENKEEKEEEKIRLTQEFENLANRILDENSNKFQKQNKKEIDSLLKPLNEKIKDFQEKVEETNKEDIKRNSSLITQIENLQKLNNQLSSDATNLTKALKGESKTQGDWGEYQLEVLLEKVGLRKDIHFSTQGGYRDENGNLKKPDFIINLPDNKHLIIDSKVSLTAYEDYYNEEDKLLKEHALKKHLESIKKHYKELSEKDYPSLYDMNTPDFVLMFIPIEPALLTAFNHEKNLFLNALDKNVVLVSNSTLLATLSTVASVWKQEDQKKNALEIAQKAGLLYDKFEGFVQDLLDIGVKINASQTSYTSAMEKLTDKSGNLIWQVERLKKLGAKTKKSIPQKLIDRSDNE